MIPTPSRTQNALTYLASQVSPGRYGALDTRTGAGPASWGPAASGGLFQPVQAPSVPAMDFYMPPAVPVSVGATPAPATGALAPAPSYAPAPDPAPPIYAGATPYVAPSQDPFVQQADREIGGSGGNGGTDAAGGVMGGTGGYSPGTGAYGGYDMGAAMGGLATSAAQGIAGALGQVGSVVGGWTGGILGGIGNMGAANIAAEKANAGLIADGLPAAVSVHEAVLNGVVPGLLSGWAGWRSAEDQESAARGYDTAQQVAGIIGMDVTDLTPSMMESIAAFAPTPIAAPVADYSGMMDAAGGFAGNDPSTAGMSTVGPSDIGYSTDPYSGGMDGGQSAGVGSAGEAVGGGGYSEGGGYGQGEGGGMWWTGGFTGYGSDGRLDRFAPAGVVHEGEGILNAPAMSRYGAPLLDLIGDINSGAVPMNALQQLARLYGR